jgi:hypothetical protein
MRRRFFPDGNSVPVGTDITGPADIALTCPNLRILQNGWRKKIVSFTALSSARPGTASIENVLTKVELARPAEQLLLGVAGCRASGV